MPRQTKARKQTAMAQEKSQQTSATERRRKIKKMKVTNAAKARVKNVERRVLEAVDQIFDLKETAVNCPHYLIGAASVERLLKGRYNMKKAHGHLQPRKDEPNWSWKVAEAVSESSHSEGRRQALRIHPYIPFICAKADIFDAARQMIVETKSTKDREEMERMKVKIPDAILTQMWVTMECFGVDKGELDFFFFDETAQKHGQHMYLKGSFFRACQHTVIRTAPFFTETNITRLVDRYVQFLRRYLSHANLVITERFTKDLTKNIVKRISDAKFIFEREQQNPDKSRDLTQQLVHSMRTEKIGTICQKFNATGSPGKVSYKGELIPKPVRDITGYIKDNYNYEERRQLYPTIVYLNLNLTAEYCDKLFEKYETSRQKFLAKGRIEGEQGSEAAPPDDVE